MTPAISVASVSKRFRVPLDRSNTLKYRMVHPRSTSKYQDFFALQDINFDIPAGEFTGIVGHNGCGKSTLLKILAGIYKPTSGSVTINGPVSPFLELGVGFNPELTARENVFVNGAVLGLTRGELTRRFDDIIGFAGLEEKVDQKVKTFSSGQEVRLAFSVAIQANADILLMDEVLAVGDAQFQAKCFDIFAQHKRAGKTVVLVTHDLGAVEQYCDRAILLDHGHIINDGAPGEVTAHYRRMVGEASDAAALAIKHGGRIALDPANPESRWGSGEVRVRDVTLVNDSGEEHHTFTSGHPMTVAVNVDVASQVNDLICGISLHRADGYTLAGTNTFICKVPVKCPPAGQAMHLEYVIPELTLLGGSYRLSIGLSSGADAHHYDKLDQLVEFRVVDESGRIGVFELGGAWTISAGKPAAALPSAEATA